MLPGHLRPRSVLLFSATGSPERPPHAAFVAVGGLGALCAIDCGARRGTAGSAAEDESTVRSRLCATESGELTTTNGFGSVLC